MVASACYNSFAALLESAVLTRSPRLARATHAFICKLLPSPPPQFLRIYLINAYSKLDLEDYASLVLRLDPLRCTVSWTSLVSGLIHNGRFRSALLQFRNMLRDNVKPNDYTLPCAFKAAAWAPSFSFGKQAHAASVKWGLIVDCYVGCSAFDMYSKSGNMLEAKKLFEEMPIRNVATWNAVISNSVLDGSPAYGLQVFVEFRRDLGEPDSITFCAFLNGCADLFYLNGGMQLHGLVISNGFEGDVFVCNGLIDFYGKCNEVRCAEAVFRGMKTRNLVSWNSMVAVFQLNKEEENACITFLKCRKENEHTSDFLVSSVLSAVAGLAFLDLGRSVHALAVKSCGESNVFVNSALVDMYGKCGSIEDCERKFNEMPQRNMVAWNALICGYAHQGCAVTAITSFRRMVSEVIPSNVTFVCVLAACSRGGLVDIGLHIFESMKKRYGIQPGVEHYACVVDLLSRAGMVQRAYDFMKNLPVPPTISMWGSLVNACRVYGKPDLGKIAAVNLFALDPKDSGNHVLLSNMFAAAGRWEEAKEVRDEMKHLGIRKNAGCSWISVKSKVHIFQAKDANHAKNPEIQEKLSEMTNKLNAAGYVPDTSYALYDLEEEEKIAEVGHHSEKIALAFGLLVLPRGVPVRITKNLRICGDCHIAFKILSSCYEREIVVRDNNRFHCFRNNSCSCKDYW